MLIGAEIRCCNGPAGSVLAGMWGESAGSGLAAYIYTVKFSAGIGQGKGSGGGAGRGLCAVAVPGGFELGAVLAAWAAEA